MLVLSEGFQETVASFRAAVSLLIWKSLQPHPKFESSPRGARLFVDVTRVLGLKQPTGIPRTVTSLARALIAKPPTGLVPQLIRFSPNGQASLVANDVLESGMPSRGGNQGQPVFFAPGDLVLLLDLSLPPQSLRQRQIRLLKHHGVTLISLFYDALPALAPDLFPKGKKFVFEQFLKLLPECGLVLPISETSRADLISALKALGLETPPLATLRLAGQALPEARSKTVRKDRDFGDAPRVLMVGTLEPRKSYTTALNAFEEALGTSDEFQLTIVGRRGWKCSAEVTRIKFLQRHRAPIFWVENMLDEDLFMSYQESDLLLACSVAEGYGLPLDEAASADLPILARDIPAFRELDAPMVTFFTDDNPESVVRNVRTVASRFRKGYWGKRFQQPRRDWSDVGDELVAAIEDSIDK